MTGMTHAMVKGSNVPLDAPGVRAVLRWTPGSGTPDVDASVLLLGQDGKVRSDADFVFYNEPRHPTGVARHLPKKRVPEGLTDTVEVDLAALDASVDRVVVAASCDGGTFRLVRDLCVLLYDTSAQDRAPLLTFDVQLDTGAETALNCGELYRKDGGWKFRAVAQGYATGLVGLATEFGITVDDEDAGDATQAAPPTVQAPAQPQPRPHQGPQHAVPRSPEEAEAASAYGYPLPAPAAGHVPAQPAYGYPQPVAAAAPPPPPQPAQPATGPAVVHQQPQPGYPAYGYPQPVAGPTQPRQSPGQGFVLPLQGPQFQGPRR
jgi:stress response protein SCP2